MADDLIGKEYRYLDKLQRQGVRPAIPMQRRRASRQLVHIIEPVEFSRLMKPDAANPCAEAIVYQSGKTFLATKTEQNPRGRNYLSVLFSRDI